MTPAKLTDDELIEALEGAAPRLRLARVDELRRVADAVAGVALEAAARFRAARLAPGPLVGRARRVVIHADGRLTCELEIDDGVAGARFLEQIGGRS